MVLYEKYVKMMYQDRCYWYRDALIESKKSKEHENAWKGCLDCYGDNIGCVNYELDINGDLENIIKEIDLNSINIGGL